MIITGFLFRKMRTWNDSEEERILLVISSNKVEFVQNMSSDNVKYFTVFRFVSGYL